MKWRFFFAFIYKIIFSQLPASRLIDWWWGDGDPDSSASAAFCGFPVTRAEPGAVGWWREWLHRDGLTPESCQCTFHDSMNSDVRDQAEVTLLHIISGSHPDGVPCGWRSSRCCIKSHPTAKKKAELPDAHLQPKHRGSPLIFTKKIKWIYLCSLNNCGHHSPLVSLETSGCSLGILFLCVFSLESSYVWPNLNINFLPRSQLRWWVLRLIIPGLIETKTPRLMHEMHVSPFWMPLAAASGCSLLLHSLWTVSVSLNKNSGCVE